MPILKCTKNNRSGYKCGEEGECYTYTRNNAKSREMAKQKAIDQCLAMGEKPSDTSMNDDREDAVVELKSADIELDDQLLISSVQQPAIGTNFIHFNHQGNTNEKEPDTKYHLSGLDEEKRIISGPAMVPDRSIERLSDDGEKYFVYFSKETVEELSERLISNCNISTTVEHSMNVDDVHMVESWIVHDPDNDKCNHFGFDSSNINPGTWFVSFKCHNDEFWNKVKDGEIAGFSIEGYFIENFKKHFTTECDECEKQNKEDDEEIPQEELKQIYKVLKSLKDE